MHTHAHTLTHTRTHTCTHTGTHTHMHIHRDAHTHTHRDTHTCTHTQGHTHAGTHVHTHTGTHTHMHTHTHTHTQGEHRVSTEEAETAVMQLQPKEHRRFWPPPEAREKQKVDSLSEAPKETNHANTLILDFQTPKTKKKKSCCFRPASSW